MRLNAVASEKCIEVKANANDNTIQLRLAICTLPFKTIITKFETEFVICLRCATPSVLLYDQQYSNTAIQFDCFLVLRIRFLSERTSDLLQCQIYWHSSTIALWLAKPESKIPKQTITHSKRICLAQLIHVNQCCGLADHAVFVPMCIVTFQSHQKWM